MRLKTKYLIFINKLATTTGFTAIEKKTNFSNAVKKTDYKTKFIETENKIITDHDHDRYITTQEFN